MASDFGFDVFLSHSSKDKLVVRSIAERLRRDGLRVWFDEWEIRLGDSIPAVIEDGLERSRVLILCMSANAFGSDWAQLEGYTFRFRDPLNKARRFIPVRLDDAPIKGVLAQFLHVRWFGEDHDNEYARLLESCRPPAKPVEIEEKISRKGDREQATRLALKKTIRGEAITPKAYAFSSDGKRVLTGDSDGGVRLWDAETGRCLLELRGHRRAVFCVVWSNDQRRALSSSDDGNLRLWDLKTGDCIRIFEGHSSEVNSVSWSPDQLRAISASSEPDNSLRLWDIDTGKCLHVFQGHTAHIWTAAWNADQRLLLSGSSDNTIRLWDVDTGKCLRILEGHTGGITSIDWSIDRVRILSASSDKTVRLWDVSTGLCLRVLEGHTNLVGCVAWCADGRHALSGSDDTNLRLWDVETGQCLRVLEGHKRLVRGVVWNDRHQVLSGDSEGDIRAWDLSGFFAEPRPIAPSPAPTTEPDQIQYTNAKVLLVGESGSGKTGLSKALAGETWQPSDSTVGVWATQWKLPLTLQDGFEREVWLWDFGGQADQRLIHQLYMNETALAALVFDGQKEDVFEALGQWDRDLMRASTKPFSKLLVAGRIDAGGLRVSRNQIENFGRAHGYAGFFETSAKFGTGCDELKGAIVTNINWDDIPWRSSPLLFKRLKEEIVRLKDDGRVLMRFNELREMLQLRLANEVKRFTDGELMAVIGLLASPGLVWELKFGSWILLQPERINAYAQAVIQTMRKDEHERGCIQEEDVLTGQLNYQSSMVRLESEEERFVLLAMHQILIERGLCLREHTEKGPLLIFPSYYRRERPDLVGHPAPLVSYRFSGFFDEIYATLIVRLHHTSPFTQAHLWRYAADFKTLTGKQLGVKLTRRAENEGELEVYFDPTIPIEEKIIFSKYIHEHLLQNAKEVVRLRHYICPHCGTPVGNRSVAMKRLEDGRKDIACVNCDEATKRVPLWDQMEDLFASEKIKEQVQMLQEQSSIVLDSESKERALVGDVISTVALAGQICREKSVSDHGIDMEVEFKNDNNEATGKMMLLQLKSGDSYLRQRKRDGKEVFTVKDERHVRYWMAQAFPVLLILRGSNGEVRWMEVRDYLRRESDNGKKVVRQIVFEGRRFDVMSVRRWREVALEAERTLT